MTGIRASQKGKDLSRRFMYGCAYRWIEVFKSTRGEMESIMYPDMMGGPGGYGGDPYFYGGGAGGMYAEDVAFGPGGGRRGGGGGGGIPPPFRHGHAPYDRPMHPPPIGGYGPSRKLI